jgi:hypothetical protein
MAYRPGRGGLVERDAPLQEHLADPRASVREVAKKAELQAVVAIEVIMDSVLEPGPYRSYQRAAGARRAGRRAVPRPR